MQNNLKSSRNFAVNDETPEMVHDGSLDFPEKYNWRVLGGGLKPINLICEKVWIEIDKKSIPEYLEIDTRNLLKIEFTGRPDKVKPAMSISELPITRYQNPYKIIYNPKAVKDCKSLEADWCEVNFTLNFLQSADYEVKTIDFVLRINMTKAAPQLNVEFDYASGANEIQFAHTDHALLGHLRITGISPVDYAHRSAMKAKLQYDQAFNADIVQFGHKSELGESAPYREAAAGITGVDEELPSCLKAKVSEQDLELLNLVSNNTVSIPVYIDLTRIGNPSVDKMPKAFSLAIENMVNGYAEVMPFNFNVLRDDQRTELKVIANGTRLENGQSLTLPTQKWVERGADGKRFLGTSNVLTLKIANAAESVGDAADAAVYVKGLNATVECDIPALAEAFSITAVQSEAKLLNAPNSHIALACRLNHGRINSIPNYAQKVRVNVEFDYCEDLEGAGPAEFEHFSTTIDFVLETDPGTEWLCIDFGTSATVASFGDGETIGLLNLDDVAAIKGQTLTERLRTRFEEGTPFLSSNCKLRQDGVFCEDGSVGYGSNFVQLAPTEPQFYSDSFNLPYMKSIIGYDTLPLKYKSLRYKKSGSSDSIEFKSEDFPVDKIFRSVYRSLIEDFVSPAINLNQNRKPVNKVILSVPNTYTPRHLDYLRDIIKKNLPDVRDNYVWFISESDAIASYYITNWDSLNSHRDTERYDRLNQLGSEEYVVAFDMGAGTLDVTYFVIRRVESGVRRVDMLAKIGLNKAGNYLDYVLAEALVDTYPKYFPTVLLQPKDEETLIKRAGCLKQLVRETLKIKLFDEDSITFKFSNLEDLELDPKVDDDQLVSVTVDTDKIRNHPALKAFVRECTSDLLDNLFTTCGNVKHDTPIDTVIFTGRSVQFGAGHTDGIRQAVMTAIAEWDNDPEREAIDIKGDALKTVVCEGALSFASVYCAAGSAVEFKNKNIYASYGVIYKDADNRVQYKELINPSTKPTVVPNIEGNSSNGTFVYQYDTDVDSAAGQSPTVPAQGGTYVYFVQSYSKNTAKDFKEGRLELISVMWAAPVAAAVSNPREREHLPVRIEVNADNEMTFTAGNLTNIPSASMKIDINKSEAFKKGLWPYCPEL